MLVAGLAGLLALTTVGSPTVPANPDLQLASATDGLPPTNVVITPGNGQFSQVSWTASTEPTVTGYRVYVGSTLNQTVNGTTTTAPITGLVNGTDYTVRVVTRSQGGFLDLVTYYGTVAATATSYPRDGVAPAAPTGVTAVRGDGQVQVAWAANTESDLAGYRVLRDGTPVSGTLTGRSWTDTGLTNDTTYRYTVEAVDVSRQWSAPSSPAVAATPTDLTPPSVPTGLTAVRGDGRVTLSWTANPEPDLASYRVLRDGVEVATVTGATTWTDTGRTNDVAYGYRLAAVDTHGNRSAASSPAVSATPTDLTPPAVPTGLIAVRGDGRVTLSWTANPEPDLATYRLYGDGSVLTTVTGRTFVDTGLTNDTTYRYAIAAVDTHGNASATSTPVVPATPTDLTAPATPTGLTAVRGDGQVTLTWTANTEPDLATYRVLRDGTEVATVAGRSWTDTGLTNDRAYGYQLVAVDTHGNRSAATTTVGATPTDLTPPAVPSGLAAARGEQRVTLSWTANTEPDLAGYRVLRDGREVATVTGTSYTDTGLTDDQAYAYRLVAVDTHGNRSAPTASVSATPTDLTAPATPAGLVAVRGDGRVDLSWTANTEPDLAGYRLYRDGLLLTTVTGTSYADTGLTNDTTYRYAIAAVDTHGNASPTTSPVVPATPTDLTPPATPTGLVAVHGDGSVTLTWTASTDPDLATYRVLRDGTEIATVTGTGYTDTAVTNDTAYGYQLVAVDTHGNRSAPTGSVPATPTDLTAPAVPTGLVAVRGDGRVDLSWTANTEPDLAGYRLYRDGVLLTTVSGTSYADTGLTDDTTYRYAIAAVDTHGNASATSAPSVPGTPTDLTAPATPAGLVAVRGDGRVTLTWTAGTEPDLATYRVLRDGTEIATVTGPAFTDTSVTNDTAYGYALVAVDTHGNRSPASTVVSATPTDLTAPGAPTAPVATGGERQVLVSWTAPADPDVARYQVLVGGAPVATVSGTAATLTGLAPGTAVALTVVAVDGHGNVSAASVVVTAVPYDRTAPAAPTAVTGRGATGTATIGWTAPADPDVLVFRVLRDGVPVLTTGTSPVTVTGLVDGTSYAFTVVAVDPSGNASVASAAVVVVPVGVTVPALGSGETGGLAVSGDGRFVVVGTRAQLEASDTNTAYELYRLDRTAGTATRIAPLPASATTADPTNAAAPAVSDDGRYVVLATTAKLVAADTNGLPDVYRLDTTTGTWALVSVPVNGRVSASVAGTVLQTGSAVAATSPSVVVSGDGDLVLFYSARTDLGPTDTNGVVDVYAKRMSTGAVTRVSTTATGADLPRTVTGPALALTPDGRYALFPATGPNGPLVLYRKTLSGTGAGEATVVSIVGSTEVAVYRDTGDVDLSDDGRYVAFVTSARPAAPGSSWSVGLAYRKDTVTGALTPLGDGQTAAWEHQVALDPTGRYGFYSTTAAVVPGDTNGHTDVHRRDLGTGALVLVTADVAGRSVTGPAGAVAAGEYGRVVAVSGDLVVLATSQALVPADGNRLRDLYLKDMATGVVLSPVS
ncbi:fibronectin type 3 domain-containing protein [Klenkia soli]|uniref:Fibronectin type 3 domain-containing protein n=1 Tax=Klenkia soli TaxID=1052260 RepID=A0A1H0UI59_9ACTN|nr:fibronectin type 3 domain-containing protein [Klenkia soli]